MTNSQTMFGSDPAPQPAIPGSYGVSPEGFRLPEATSLGPVHLQVADLDRSIGFYERVLGMRVAHRTGAAAHLAAQDEAGPLVVLHGHAGATSSRRRAHLGLFHYALLLPDRPSLGRFVRHLATIGEQAGAGDHLVSEAFYLADPDGHGIEVYADRPRSTWLQVGRELVMATDPVDVDALLRDAGDEPWNGMPAGAVMGHVHLHVGNLTDAAAYYSEAVGFSRMVTRYPGALFLAAGDYHHHLGTNTWAGGSARAPGPDDARLLEWTVMLPDRASLLGVAESLAQAGYEAKADGDSAVVSRDPWGTQVRFQLAVLNQNRG
jgi:catechol 2,3-dioxygenase